jgi:sec-independent protein translocase protein TatA
MSRRTAVFTCENPYMAPLFAVGISVPALIVLGIVVLLLFGNRLPSVMRSLGRGVVEFKKGLHGEEESGEGESKKIEESVAKGAASQTESAAKREEVVEKK